MSLQIVDILRQEEQTQVSQEPIPIQRLRSKAFVLRKIDPQICIIYKQLLNKTQIITLYLFIGILLLIGTIAMESYKALRIYRRESTMRLLNALMCNRIMKRPSLVANAPRMYKMSCSFFGVNLTNAIINKTFCSLLTAGNTIAEASKMADGFRAENISIILDYSAEGEENASDISTVLDDNAAKIIQCVRSLDKHSGEMVAVKITGLIQMSLLKKINLLVEQRNTLWDNHNKGGKLSGKQLQSALNVGNDEIKTYLKVIYNYSNSIQSFQVDEVQFKMNHHPWYLYKEDKNGIFANTFTKQQKTSLSDFSKRLNQICSFFQADPGSYKVLIDAEQTYLQKAIQCIAEQMQQRYNKNILHIIPTVQCYLKDSVERGKYQIEIAKRKGLFFGAKLVRGAYLVEESKLAKEKNVECRVVECFERTTQNYLNNFQAMYEGVQKGQIIVATHNLNTIEAVQKIQSKKQNSGTKVCFAQLVGLADHLTWLLKNDYTVYKYLPWAETKVMIPYIIRRAEELSQMKYPLDIQYELLQHQLKTRAKLE